MSCENDGPPGHAVHVVRQPWRNQPGSEYVHHETGGISIAERLSELFQDTGCYVLSFSGKTVRQLREEGVIE